LAAVARSKLPRSAIWSVPELSLLGWAFVIPSRVNTLNKADTIGALANRTIRKIITSGRVFHFKGPKCLSERYKNSQSIFQSEQILKLMLLGDPSREAIHNTANTLQFARNGAVGLQRNFPTLAILKIIDGE